MDGHDSLIARLRALGREPLDPTTTGRHLSAMAVAGAARAPRSMRLKVAGAFFAGLLLGGTGLATAGALPGPAQDAAHTALSTVGVNVPTGHGPARYNGPECGTDPQTGQPFRNHGQYVRAHTGDPNAGSSRCGKPIQAGAGGAGNTDSTEAPETDRGGPPPFAHGNHGNHGKGQANDQPDVNTPSTVAPAGGTQTPTTAAPSAPSTTAAPSTTVASTSTSTSSTTSSTAPRSASTTTGS